MTTLDKAKEKLIQLEFIQQAFLRGYLEKMRERNEVLSQIHHLEIEQREKLQVPHTK